MIQDQDHPKLQQTHTVYQLGTLVGSERDVQVTLHQSALQRLSLVLIGDQLTMSSRPI